MIRARCSCGWVGPVVRMGVACRDCGKRKLRPAAAPARVTTPRPPPTPLAKLPPQGGKLRAFLNAEGISERAFARLLTKRMGRPVSRSTVQSLIYGRSRPGWRLARTVARIMAMRGYEPAVFYPGAASSNTPQASHRNYRHWYVEQHGEDPWR